MVPHPASPGTESSQILEKNNQRFLILGSSTDRRPAGRMRTGLTKRMLETMNTKAELAEAGAIGQAAIDGGWIDDQSHTSLAQPALGFVEEPFQPGAHGINLHGAEPVYKRGQAEAAPILMWGRADCRYPSLLVQRLWLH